MRKKIILAATLLSATLAQAEIDQRGFFVGVDYSQKSSELKYENKGTLSTNPYTNDYSDDSFSLKAGYQAYSTRVYARYTSFEYKDDKRNKFTIDSGRVYELNADYIPQFYLSKAKDWNIRGIFGLGVGYNSSTLTDLDGSFLLPVGDGGGTQQNYMEYGYQVGVMSETSLGLSVEAGYRMRYGNVQEFSDGSNDVAFLLETQEFYLGLNYLF